MSIMNTQQIMDILPHRSPFLLIDTVEELQPGVKCVAKKNVTMNEPHFMGLWLQRGFLEGCHGGYQMRKG